MGETSEATRVSPADAGQNEATALALGCTVRLPTGGLCTGGPGGAVVTLLWS